MKNLCALGTNAPVSAENQPSFVKEFDHMEANLSTRLDNESVDDIL